jgi:hypothetical protein
MSARERMEKDLIESVAREGKSEIIFPTFICFQLFLTIFSSVFFFLSPFFL